MGEDVEPDGKVMEDAARQHADVPDAVEEGSFVHGEEEDSPGVAEAARQQPCRALPGDGSDQGAGGEDDEPSHCHVGDGGEDVESLYGEGFEGDAHQGDRPDGGEEGPPGAAVQGNEGKRSIGSGDQQVDGGVVEDHEDVASAGADEGVVKGRADVDQDEG